MKALKKVLLGVTFAFAGLTVGTAVVDIVSSDAIVHAATIFDDADAKAIDSSATNAQSKSIIEKIRGAANILAAIVLSISIIMIIFGGLRYILSNGDAKQAEQGKMILLYSGLGIIIALSAFAIAKFFSSFGF